MEQQPNVSPEEQEQYDAFVDASYQAIYGDAFPEIEKRLRSDEDPIDAVAKTTVEVVRRVVASAREAGRDVPGDVLMHAGIEVLEDLASTMGKLAIHEFSAEDLERATYLALDNYREVEAGSGELNEEVAQADWQTLQQANESGELDTMMQDLKAKSGGQIPAALQQGQAAPNEVPTVKRGLGR